MDWTTCSSVHPNMHCTPPSSIVRSPIPSNTFSHRTSVQSLATTLAIRYPPVPTWNPPLIIPNPLEWQIILVADRHPCNLQSLLNGYFSHHLGSAFGGPPLVATFHHDALPLLGHNYSVGTIGGTGGIIAVVGRFFTAFGGGNVRGCGAVVHFECPLEGAVAFTPLEGVKENWTDMHAGGWR